MSRLSKGLRHGGGARVLFCRVAHLNMVAGRGLGILQIVVRRGSHFRMVAAGGAACVDHVIIIIIMNNIISVIIITIIILLLL